MAEKKTVTIELQAKTGEAQASLKDVADAINNLSDENKKANDKIIKSQSKLGKGVKALGKGFKGLGLAMKATGFAIIMKIVGKLSDALMRNQEVADAVNTVFTAIGIVFKQISDVMLDVFKNVSEATGGFDALQKVLGGGLSIAINVVVGAIQGMMLGVKKAQLAWEDSFLGGKDPETIKRLQAEITEVGNKLDETGNRIKKAGSQIADNFLEAVGEVGELASGIAEGVSDSIEKIDVKSAISNAKRVVQNKKNYGLLEAQSQRLIEQYDLEAETQRQIRDDDRKSIEERIKANDELGKVLEKQTTEEKNAINSRISALQEQVRLEGESVELTNELYGLNTELIAIDAKVAGFKSEQLVNQAALQKENIELTNTQKESENQLSIERKRFNAEQIEDELARLQALDEIDIIEQEKEQLRLQAIVDNANAGTQAKIDAQIVLDDFNEQSRQTNLTRDKEIAKAKEDINKAEEDSAREKTKAVGNALNQLSQIAGENTVVGKGLAVAAATINTYQGVTDALAAKTVTPFDTALKFINAASILSNGLKTVRQIASIKVPTPSGGGGGASGGGNVGGGGGLSQPPAFNVVGASGTNQLADAIGSQSQEPVRAFVVSNDVTTAQSMDRNIVDGASI